MIRYLLSIDRSNKTSSTSVIVRGLSLALIVIFLGIGADVARAHNSYDSSTPADGDVLGVSPSEWTITFAKEVPLDSASAEIITADGVRADLGAALAGPQSNVIRFVLPENLSGAIGLRWKLIGQDGHVVSGRVGFTVDPTITTPGAVPPSTPTTTATTEDAPQFSDANPAPEPVRWLVRLAVYVALLVVVGLVVSELFIAQGTLRSERGSLLLRVSGSTLTVGSWLQLLFLLGDIHGTSIFGAVGKLSGSFDSTALGMTTLRLFVGITVVCMSFVRITEADEERVSRSMIGLLGLFGLALAFTGHSRSRAWPVLGVPADVAHTAAIATWLGGLTILLLVVLPMVDDRDALETFRRFGRLATIAVPVMIGTGVVQTLRLHGGITTLFSQTHGRVLLLKLVLVVGMLALANKSRKLNLRRIAEEAGRVATRRQQLTRAALTECVVGGTVVAVTAILVTSNFG